MSDYKRLRVLFPDHLGLARGKYIPGGRGTSHVNHCIGTFSLHFDRTMTPAPGTKMLEGLPDCRAVFSADRARPGWEAGTAVVVADLEFQGAPLAIAPRQVLRRAIADWDALGCRAKVGIELEAYVLQPDGRGGWDAWDTPGAFVYGTGSSADPAGLFDEIMETAAACGFPIESINSEYDAPQFELTLVFDDALQAVDNIFLFKVMAREVAARKGLLLTFLGKPFAARSGSGLHVNFSMLDDQGNNRLADPAAADGLSGLARQCIAGLVAHHAGMAALCVPTVNGYKRLRPGQLAGYWANWGYDHRGVTVRVPDGRGLATRLEHRMSDGAANPYLATAAVLQAARLGVTQNLAPPDPEQQDCLEHQSTDQHVPDDLGRALDALEADQPLVEAVGSELAALFLCIKRAEWQKFTAAVTDWELNYYLPFL
ncbi:MAG TPA: glutamine synthetase family protein [Vicinamibacterales bacterium]|nr:glutamine synthetase family protein [Vicinamibacterales bacterium]